MNPFDVAELDVTTSDGYSGGGGSGTSTTGAFVNFKRETTAHMSKCCMLDIMQVFVSDTPSGRAVSNLIDHPQTPLVDVIATAMSRHNAPSLTKKGCMELNLKMAYSYLRQSISILVPPP
jgi:hypothetical protein